MDDISFLNFLEKYCLDFKIFPGEQQILKNEKETIIFWEKINLIGWECCQHNLRALSWEGYFRGLGTFPIFIGSLPTLNLMECFPTGWNHSLLLCLE